MHAATAAAAAAERTYEAIENILSDRAEQKKLSMPHLVRKAQQNQILVCYLGFF